MKILLLLTLWVTSTALIAETIDKKRFRTSPFLTKSKQVSIINAKILADQYKNLLNDEERIAFVDTTLTGDFDFNQLSATAAGNDLIDETVDEMRHRTSPFSKETTLSMNVKAMSDQYNNLLDDLGRAEFDDAVLADDVDFNALPATAAGSKGCEKNN